MSEFWILLRRELTQKLSVFHQGKKPDILGWILSFVLTITIAGIFILIFGIFVDTYTKVQIGYVSDIVARKYEILTIMFAVTLVINIVAGIIKINTRISSGHDLMLLMTLPIKNSTLFAVKFVMIFLELIVMSWLILLPLSITFCIVTGHSVDIIFVSALLGIFLPIIALSFCSILALPLFYLKKILSKFYYLTTLIFSALVIGAFVVYAGLLNFVKLLLETGQIHFIFNESSANTVLEQVSEYELSLVNTTLLTSLNSEYELYLLTLSSEVLTATEISEISLGGLKLAFYIANIFILLGLMIIIRFRLS